MSKIDQLLPNFISMLFNFFEFSQRILKDLLVPRRGFKNFWNFFKNTPHRRFLKTCLSEKPPTLDISVAAGFDFWTMKPILSYRMDDSESGEFNTLPIYDLLTPQKVNFQNNVFVLLKMHSFEDDPMTFSLQSKHKSHSSCYFRFFEPSHNVIGQVVRILWSKT